MQKAKEMQFDPWDRKIPWRRAWLPVPVFLPGEFHGQKSPVGYSPWGCKESDTTEWLTLSRAYIVLVQTIVSQALQTWVIYSTYLNLFFLICKMMIILTVHGRKSALWSLWWELNELKQTKSLARSKCYEILSCFYKQCMAQPLTPGTKPQQLGLPSS